MIFTIDAMQSFRGFSDLQTRRFRTKSFQAERLYPFALGTADAAFLFDDRLAAYLKEMRGHAAAAQSIDW